MTQTTSSVWVQSCTTTQRSDQQPLFRKFGSRFRTMSRLREGTHTISTSRICSLFVSLLKSVYENARPRQLRSAWANHRLAAWPSGEKSTYLRREARNCVTSTPRSRRSGPKRGGRKKLQLRENKSQEGAFSARKAAQPVSLFDGEREGKRLRARIILMSLMESGLLAETGLPGSNPRWKDLRGTGSPYLYEFSLVCHQAFHAQRWQFAVAPHLSVS